MGPNGYPEEFFHDARKFDSGGKPNPLLLPMIRASLEQVLLLDRREAQDYFRNLMNPLLAWARSHGYIVTSGPHVYHLVSIEPPGLNTDAVLAMANTLKDRGFHVAVRCGGLRISPYLNTTTQDIHQLIKVLESVER